jgi:predicted enzyme related to lactoylglutathione lyase
MTKRNIVHIEIPTRNLEESGEFYKKLFAWKVTPMPESNYSMWEPAEGPAGGFNPLGEGVTVGSVLIYIDSDDITADLKKAKSLGATFIKDKSEIPGYGWFGIFKDPTGNSIALYKATNPT